jgi:hypothetical protein
MKFLFVLAAIAVLSSSAQALTFDSDVPAAIQAQMKDDLKVVYQITGSGKTPFHLEIFGKVEGAAYKNFFETRVLSVGMDDCGGGGAVACVQPGWDPTKMWLSPNFVQFDMGQMERLNIIFHEARHTEEDAYFWGHDDCPVPFLDETGHDIRGSKSGIKLEGLPACDSTLYGSYGSSTIMAKNIAKYCTNCTDKIKQDAELLVEEMMLRMYKPTTKNKMRADFAH